RRPRRLATPRPASADPTSGWRPLADFVGLNARPHPDRHPPTPTPGGRPRADFVGLDASRRRVRV
ncbi:MAG TPA: hypothetical protein VFH02_01325, partial [Jiangellaceae bacterium]|nr:hypothetical protein [Jiangellaceae bacterium]